MFSIFKKKTPIEVSLDEIKKQSKLIEELQEEMGKASITVPSGVLVTATNTWTTSGTISNAPGSLVYYNGTVPVTPYWQDSSYMEIIPTGILEKELAKRRAKEADVQFKQDLKDLLEE